MIESILHGQCCKFIFFTLLEAALVQVKQWLVSAFLEQQGVNASQRQVLLLQYHEMIVING